MKSILNLSIPLLFSITMFGQGENSLDEIDEIRTTINLYFAGTRDGKPQKLREAFHPDFNLYTVDTDGKLITRSGEQYISNTKEGIKTNRIARIISIDVENNTAVAKAEILVPAWRIFTDYFLLLKYQGKWKIVHKSYTWRETEKTIELKIKK
ncbi:MAG: nuclear transport factor 2 family protein [Bacteroidota bacterium]